MTLSKYLAETAAQDLALAHSYMSEIIRNHSRTGSASIEDHLARQNSLVFTSDWLTPTEIVGHWPLHTKGCLFQYLNTIRLILKRVIRQQEVTIEDGIRLSELGAPYIYTAHLEAHRSLPMRCDLDDNVVQC